MTVENTSGNTTTTAGLVASTETASGTIKIDKISTNNATLEIQTATEVPTITSR